MKENITQARIVCGYWLDKDTYFVATDEFKLGDDWDETLHGVAWSEISRDGSIHCGINIYEDERQFSGGIIEILYEDDEDFIEFPAELKKAMLNKVNEC